jgi:CysZ protein
MNFLHQVNTSWLFYYRAYRFLENNNLWRVLIVPAIVNLLISAMVVIVAIKTSGVIVGFFFANVRLASQDSDLLSFIHGVMLVVVRGMVFFLYLKIYRYLILLFMAPVFARISYKVQSIVSGNANKAQASAYLHNCMRGIRIALINLFIEVVLSSIIILISFIISWLIPLAPLLILIIESWFMGYAFADYRNAQCGMDVQDSRRQIRSYTGLVVGNGLIFNIFILIPIVGVLLAPMFALIASGLSINHLEKRKEVLCGSDQSTLMMADS